MPISATYPCCQSVPPSVSVSAAYQCQSVPPISAHHCRLSVPVSATTYQCQSSVPPISAAYQCNVSVLPFSAHQ
ncbi:unnamed protein product [Staurois parvus]|uniref:Uncharacterized protein n=1 Tax=Staurois parvus TaxID=386267 RepID=A0ABN9FBC1_9NEOB|nr:unnamed protein product [Staurois parvus]